MKLKTDKDNDSQHSDRDNTGFAKIFKNMNPFKEDTDSDEKSDEAHPHPHKHGEQSEHS